jgi:hypothetical protein
MVAWWKQFFEERNLDWKLAGRQIIHSMGEELTIRSFRCEEPGENFRATLSFSRDERRSLKSFGRVLSHFGRGK